MTRVTRRDALLLAARRQVKNCKNLGRDFNGSSDAMLQSRTQFLTRGESLVAIGQETSSEINK